MLDDSNFPKYHEPNQKPEWLCFFVKEHYFIQFYFFNNCYFEYYYVIKSVRK
jgi:hypothetical protein